MLVLLGISRAIRNTIKEYAEFLYAMPATEARSILNIPADQNLTHNLIEMQALKIRKSNESVLPVSSYIIKKIDSAERVLNRELE